MLLIPVKSATCAGLTVPLLILSMTTSHASNSITSPDTVGDVGRFSSLVLDASGYPVVSYLDSSNKTLKIMHCNDMNCAGGDESITSPDTGSSVGMYSSLVLDASGYPVVSYFDSLDDPSSGALKIMHCNDANCTGGDESFTSPDIGRGIAVDTSIVLDASGYPVVSYHDTVNGDLKLLHCNDANCAGGDDSITSPDTVGDVGRFSSLVLDASGYPVVSYHDVTNDDLKLLHCNDANCAGGDESITSPDTEGGVGVNTSLVLDASGYPVVSYNRTNTGPRIMHCNDVNCAGGDESITSFWEYTNGTTSLVLDASGYPVVSYRNFGITALEVMHCNDVNCAGGDERIATPDADGDVGSYNSLALDADGYPVVSYYDYTNGDLKLLHCDNANCTAPPVADAAGPYSGLTNIGITLDGSGSTDPDGDPLTYSWAVDSVNCSFDDHTHVSPMLTCTVGGSYTVTLTVDDGELNDSDSAAVIVNTPPVPEAGGPYSGLPNIGITLDGSGSTDPDGDPLTYNWAVDSVNCGFNDNSLEIPVLTCAVAGSYTVTLTVDDGDVNASDYATVTVNTQVQAISDIQDQLQTLVDDGILTPGQANGMSKPLRNAIRSLERGQIEAACSQLQDFIDEVNAKTPTPLDATTATELVADAMAIRASLGCF